MGIADKSRILFGSDYPYISADKVTAESNGLDTWDGINDAERIAINRENASALFPKFTNL